MNKIQTHWNKSYILCNSLSLQMCLHAWWKERGFFSPDLLIRAFLRTSSLLFLSRKKTFFYLLFAYARLNCLEFAYLHTFFSLLLRNSVYVSALSFQFFLVEKGIERTISFQCNQTELKWYFPIMIWMKWLIESQYGRAKEKS